MKSILRWTTLFVFVALLLAPNTMFAPSVIGTLTTTSPLDTFPVTTTKYNKGGLITWVTNLSQLVDTTSAGVPLARRDTNMLAVVQSTGKFYQWDGTTWNEASIVEGPGGAVVDTVAILTNLPPSVHSATTLGRFSAGDGGLGTWTLQDLASYPIDGLAILPSAHDATKVWLQADNSQPWNVKALGILSDGTDQLAVIQQALYNDRYSRLYFPRGLYGFSSQIAVTNGANGRTNGEIQITGDGSRQTVFLPLSTMSATPPATTPPSSNSICLDFKGFNSVTFKGFSKQEQTALNWNFYTNWYQSGFVARATGMRIRLCTNIYMFDVGLSNSWHKGFDLSDCINAKVENCWVVNSMRDAFAFDANVEGRGQWTILNSTVDGFGDSGISVLSSVPALSHPPTNCLVQGNRIWNPLELSGRYVFPYNSSQAFTINSVSDLTVADNFFGGGLGTTCVQFRAGTVYGLEWATNLFFHHNTVVNTTNSAYSFVLDGWRDAIISQNYFSHNVGGPLLQNSTNVLFTQNSLQNNTLWRPLTNGNSGADTNFQYFVYSPSSNTSSGIIYGGVTNFYPSTISNGVTNSDGRAATNYFPVGDGQMVVRNLGLVKIAGSELDTTVIGNQVGPYEGAFLTLSQNPVNTFVDDNRVSSTWSLGYDSFYGVVNVASGGAGFQIGSRNYFGDSTNFVRGTVMVNGPLSNNTFITDRATAANSLSAVLGTTNLSLSMPTLGVSEITLYMMGSATSGTSQQTNAIIHYALVQNLGSTFSDVFWEQVTNSPLTGNFRLLQRKDYLTSSGGPLTGWSITTNLVGNYNLNFGFDHRINVMYKVETQSLQP